MDDSKQVNLSSAHEHLDNGGNHEQSYDGEGSEWFHYEPSKPPHLLPPIVLAYIGDAIYEVAIRQYLISKSNLRPNHLHRTATRYVSAKAQAAILAHIEPLLTEEEREVVRQGRNAKSGSIPKNANVIDYRLATAFECLVGFLYYKKQSGRLQYLLHQGIESVEQSENNT
ncbi:Mini-ribonuclease 3 [Paenibacillus sediminis]|uniref:Mini-ribonuclease 3 n=1 Tax=Paenibacillus sediminis TaxID=664909 RepID=A0ABS4H788_9BACL|nr:Mini-ribonuclease 3 [Paenibacillus sediminis]MBP1938399.1 ribonuclease-3 family protein [Paenibacillus sediminis]